jgi:hypothetical protein
MEVMPSFHILIATIGRPSLQRMLNSLLPQLKGCDHITIVFDGCPSKAYDISGAVCQIHWKEQHPALGAHGHGIRNAYGSQLERCDFVLHADDDDVYTEGAFDRLRALCRNPSCLYIAKFKRPNGELIPPFTGIIKENYIGTPCGIIPFDLNSLGAKENRWLLRRGGDGKFYEAIAKRAKRIQEVDLILYEVG